MLPPRLVPLGLATVLSATGCSTTYRSRPTSSAGTACAEACREDSAAGRARGPIDPICLEGCPDVVVEEASCDDLPAEARARPCVEQEDPAPSNAGTVFLAIGGAIVAIGLLLVLVWWPSPGQ